MALENNSTVALNNATQVPPPGIAGARSRLELIEGYVCLTAITLAFLAAFGSMRRRCSSGLLRNSIRAAYVLSTCFLAYTMGQMQSASFRNELFAIWAVFLLIVLGGTDSITAFSLDDNEKLDSYNLQLFIQSFWMGWLIGTYESDTKFKAPLYILWLLSLVRTGERSQAMSSASRSSGLARKTKLIADFMVYEHTLSNEDELDPRSMKGYHYLVRGEDEEQVKVSPPQYNKKLTITDEVITSSKIWECKGWLLSSSGDPDGRLKDTCLSFALFRLLCRRFAGYSLPESSHEKTWRFVRFGLLAKENDYERAFRVIEVELSFLYDFFYTKYAIIFHRGVVVSRFIQVIIVGIALWAASRTLIRYHSPNGYLNLVTVSGRDVDVLVTGIVMVVIVFVEIVQLYFILFSNWFKVMLLCKYVRKSAWQEHRYIGKVISFVCHERWSKCLKVPWARQLGQYSLLEPLARNPFTIAYYYITIAYYNIATIFVEPKDRKGVLEGARIELPVEVKKAVALHLRANGRRLTNGELSLVNNGVSDELSWACRLETQTHVILVWHIATSLCEIESSEDISLAKQANQGSVKEKFAVATSLSKYCAYLAVFAPRFLPDHAYTTELIVDQVLVEAKKVLEGCNTRMSIYKKVMGISKGNPEETVIKEGAKLAETLSDIKDEEMKWKVLADLWTELMLFIAPSDDATVHAEYLARGGEFVTHLWTLLSHAGILKRNSYVQHA